MEKDRLTCSNRLLYLLDMDKTFTAQLIASAIFANCGAYNNHAISRETWHAEQARLWALAERRRMADAVRDLVMPRIGGRQRSAN